MFFQKVQKHEEEQTETEYSHKPHKWSLSSLKFYLSTQLGTVEPRASECMNEAWWDQVNSDLQPGVNPSIPPSLQQQRSGDE